MFCPKCGKINADSEEKCTGCGAPLHEETKAEAPLKKGKGFKIVLAIIAVVIVVCVALLILNGCDAGSIPKENISF